jgi:uncharacterized protein YndB with AHSA1/START domain
MTETSTDRICKEVTLRAPLSRAWRALTDPVEFGQWFGVLLDGPFRVGESIQGKITHPGCDHMMFEAQVERMDAEHGFAFRWHPVPPTAGSDTSSEASTLVEFRLQEVGDGTLLTVTESGFDSISEHNRSDAFRRNDGGWDEQMKNIRNHVDG